MDKLRFATLAEWLAWQESLHPSAIDLGLERVRRVLERLKLKPLPYKVITVGGTNGKGSTVAFLEAMLRAAGYRVGAYTSPHLLHYNERIRVDGLEVDDTTLCQTFARIDTARGTVSLTYFEFATLAALSIFQEAGIRVAVLEVGLGGRLDAVNVVDADAAVVTSIAIDHVQWLGSERESIGWEKAGIYRTGRPAICADPEPPVSLLDYADTIGACLYRVNRDYGFQRKSQEWEWWYEKTRLESLPLPSLAGEHQLGNAAAAIMVLLTLAGQLPVCLEAIRAGLTRAYIAARFQVIPGAVEWILDVAHNPHSAAALARCLQSRPCAGRTWAVLGMLADKDAEAVAEAMCAVIDGWFTATLEGPRGRSGSQLAEALKTSASAPVISHFSSVQEACRAAWGRAKPADRIVLFGSFYTVAQALTADLPNGEPLSTQQRRYTWITG